MNALIPLVILPLIEDYSRHLERQLPGLVSAFYLVGSIALGGFDEHCSDIDFVAVIERPPEEADLEQLLSIHRQIERLHPQWKMEGAYFLPEQVGRDNDEIGLYPDYHDGRLVMRQENWLGPVTWWTLKHCGIAVFGADPKELDIVLDERELLQSQLENVNSYWAGWTTKPKRIAMLLSDWGVQWAVLGVLRPFYTLRERQIITKMQAGEYAVSYLPPCWHRIIREAIGLRADPKHSLFRSRLHRGWDCWRLLRFIIQECERKGTE